MIQNGNLIKLLLDGKIVAKLMSLDANYQSEMLDITTKDSFDWKEVQPGNKEFNLSCEGLVVDPYNRNFVGVSENFLLPYWTKTGVTISSTLYAAPDGFKKANLTSGFTSIDTISVDTGVVSVAGDYVFSIWLKATVDTNVLIEISDVNSVSLPAEITVTTAWQRFNVSYTSAGGAPIVLTIQCDGTSGEIYLFGAQAERGAIPTQYEPTGYAYNALFSAIENGTKLESLITDQTTGNVQYEGDVYISSLSRTAPQGGVQTFTCELMGTGSITKATI